MSSTGLLFASSSSRSQPYLGWVWRQLLKRIKDLKPAPAKTVDDINQWVEAARGAYEQGQNVLANLDRLAEEVAERQAK